MAVRGRGLIAGTGGSMTIPAIVMFAVLMAVGGLAVDIQRLYDAHGQMQAYVDEVALAAAAELDRQPGAINRAVDAATGGNHGPLVTGSGWQNFTEGGTDLTIQKVTFLSALGPDLGPLVPTPVDGDIVNCTYQGGGFTPPGCNTDSTNEKVVTFVEVVATPKTVNYVVLPVADVILGFFGQSITSSATLTLRATAGFKRQVCNTLPLMVCNPYEATQGAGAPFTAVRGQQILAKAGGGGSWGPGNFGLLDTYPGNGDAALRQAMARVDPNTACIDSNIEIKTGQGTGPVSQGMNVRMDLYDANMKPFKNDPEYAPAPDVIKGLKPGNGANGACNPSRSDQTIPYPRDNCFMAGVPAADGTAGTGCTSYNGTARFGDGHWARATYWSTNHPAEPQPPGYIDPLSPIGGMSRYDLYRYEITHPVNRDEHSAPACSSSLPNTDPNHDRRILYIAIVNCIGDALAITNNSDIPVKAFAKVFLTEPVGNTLWNGNSNFTRNGLTWGPTSNDDFYVEVIQEVTPNDQSGLIHVYPVLYR